jgi:hypothetical protein
VAGLIDLGSALAPFAAKLADLIPDPVAKAAALQQMQLAQETMQVQLDTAQLAVNTAEASNKAIFVSGWRPFVGWVCGASYAWTYVLLPLGTFICSASGHPFTLPALDEGPMTQVLMAMMGMGMGGLRTYEKAVGIASGNKAH